MEINELSEELQKIYNLLEITYQSTNSIAKKVGLNWYRVENGLKELVKLGLAEMFEMPKIRCWKRK